MKLATKPCYPFSIEIKENDGYGTIRKEQAFGLTFRERLIIALASNPYHITSHKIDLGKYLIQTADAIIKEMEK